MSILSAIWELICGGLFLLSFLAIGAALLLFIYSALLAIFSDTSKKKDADDFASAIGLGIFSLLFGLVLACFTAKPGGYMPEIQYRYRHIFHHWSKEVKLENKIKELSSLQQRLDAKQLEIVKLQSEYEQGIQELVSEIHELQESSDIQTFTQAKEHPGILYNLSLIQRKQAYIAKLKETSSKLQYGTYELKFLEREAEDDLKMVKTLDKDVVEKLIGDINKVIAKYLPDAGKLAIEVDPNSMQSPEQIWDQINAGN